MDPKIWFQSYDEGVAHQIEFEDVTLPQYLERSAQDHPDRVALIFKNRKVTYSRLWRDSKRLATAFQRMGVEPGDRIAIHLPNLPQTVVAFYAALACGGIVVLTNPLYTGVEIEHQWNDAGCKVAVTCDFLFEQRLKDIRHKLAVQEIVITSIAEGLAFPLNLIAPLKLSRQHPPMAARVTAEDGVHRLQELVRQTPARRLPELRPGDTAVLQYTGGTTGFSKGAQLTHRNLAANLQQVNAWFGSPPTGEEVIMACLPIFHVFGMNLCMNWAVAMAATMVLEPNPRDLRHFPRPVGTT